MRMTYSLLTGLCLAFLSFISFSVCSKEIAITFDDSPRHASGYFDGATRSTRLISELKKHNVKQVAFFSVSERLDAEGLERLKKYSAAGHVIANHTHSHPNINELTLDAYAKDVLLADKKLKSLNNFKKMFRFPYLREGDTLAKRDGIRTLLREQGYTNAYITLNNYDWYIEVLFQRMMEQGGNVNFEKMRKFYVDTLMESIVYYDQMAITHLGRSPKHVLLLHEMDISALFIGDLVDELRLRGWTIISPTEAYQDDIAKYQITSPLKFNPGRIGEIAMDKGQSKGLWHKTLDEKYLDKAFAEQVLE